MISVNAISYSNIATFRSSGPNLSRETIEKLKEFNISLSSVSSETQAKRIIEEKTQAQAEAKAKENEGNAPKTDARLEKIYERIKMLSEHMNIDFSSSEKVENVLNKIDDKIAMFEENNSSASLNVFRSEFQAIQNAYEIITKSNAKLYTGLDILGETNKAIMGISDIKK